MLRFYWSLIREFPKVFRDSAEAWGFWIVSIGAPAVVLFNPQLQRWINTPQFSRWFVLVPIGLSVVYGTLRVNFAHFEAIAAERDEARSQLEHRGGPITRDDWMAMARQFERVRRGSQVYGYATARRDGPRCEIHGLLPAVQQTQALCRRAGMMLLASPRVAQRLTANVRDEPDPLVRWIRLVQDRPFCQRCEQVDEITPEGEYVQYQVTTIPELPTVSAHQCIDCSTEEI